MVRLKRRWLMVQGETDDSITKKDLIRTIRDNLVQQLGQAMTATASETQVRFWDPGTRMALIRTSRDGCLHVRAILTLMSRPAMHIRSVHGSTRTVQRAAIQFLKRHYKERILFNKEQQRTELCLQLEQHLQSIQQLE